MKVKWLLLHSFFNEDYDPNASALIHGSGDHCIYMDFASERRGKGEDRMDQEVGERKFIFKFYSP